MGADLNRMRSLLLAYEGESGCPGPATAVSARFNLDAAAEALTREAAAWQHLVRVARKVSREAYGAVTAPAECIDLTL